MKRYTFFNDILRLNGQPLGMEEFDAHSSGILEQPIMFEPGERLESMIPFKTLIITPQALTGPMVYAHLSPFVSSLLTSQISRSASTGPAPSSSA